MSRHVAPFHKATIDVANILVGGTEFHVTDHFDAAAAISAALASSHLADAAGSVGMLQTPHPNMISRRRAVGDSNHEEAPEQSKSENISACLDAIVRLAEELMASYHLLHDDGKISICAENNDCQLVSYYCKNKRDDISFNTEEIAKLLLAKEDAWTMKNNFCLFNNDFSKEPLFVKSSPKGHRRESTGNLQQETSSQLAHVLKITINEL